MTDFNDILKQKIEQFKVPYNEAHWAEMEEKLNAISRIKTIKRNIFIAAGIITVLSISNYIYFHHNNSTPVIASHNNLNTTTKNYFKTNDSQVIPKNNLKQHNTLHNTIDKNKETITDNLPKVPTNNNPLNNANNTTDSSVTTKKPINPQSLTNKKPTTEFIIYNGNVCLGDAVSFEAIENSLSVSYLWDFGDGNTSTNQKPNHNYKESGVFDVTLKIINKNTKEEFTNTKKNAINIYPKPLANFEWEETALKHDGNKLKYPYVMFKIKTDKKSDYNWHFSNGIISKIKKPEILFNTKGKYTATLNVKNTFGCTNTTSKIIKVAQSFILNDYTPTGFFPNNPIKNNTFIPKALLVMDVPFKMIITNKLGDVVFQTTDKNEPWNGKLNNKGAVLATDVYFWRVTTIDIKGISHLHAGTITLAK